MNDEKSGDRPAEEFEGRIQQRAANTVVSQEEIDDILDDPRLSPAEREARLADLRQRILDDEYARGDEEYAPLQSRIMDALSMLAEGGHDYDHSLRVEAEDGEETPPPERS